MAELWVGAGKEFSGLSAAYSAAKAGDTIFVMAGTYTDESLSIARDVKIVGVGGMAHFKSTTAIPNGKAIFVTNADVAFENIEFSGASVRDENGAGIRYESGSLTIRNSYFHDNQNGILAASNSTGTISIQNSEFARNGAGDGQTHGIYVNSIAKLTIVDSYFHDTDVGHHVKSRANHTEIRNTTLDDGALNSSYHIDLPNGGAATIVGNTLIQNATAPNKYMVHYGGEVATPKPGSVLIEGNTFIDHRAGFSVGVLNHTSKAITLKQNTFTGLDLDGEGGSFTRIDNVAGVLGEAGADTIGTAGLDKIDYRYSPGAVNVDLAAGTASDGYGSTDRLNGVEHAGGSRFADVLAGDGKANWLDGGAGADRLSGGAGDDLLEGGRGDDVIDGGAGVDTAVYDGKSSDYLVSTDGGEVVVQALNGRPEGVDRLNGIEKLRFADGVVNAPVAAANAAPTAANDQASTPSGQAVVIDVLGNDLDPNGDPLAIAAVGAAQHGSVVVQNGKVVYTPASGYVGSDVFTYQASDGRGGSAQATVSITVQPAAPPPSGRTIVGTSAGETLKGGDLAELIQAGAGNDIVYARAGDDRVEGGDGVDWLYGQDGDDMLIGGTGFDKLDGGAGDDRLEGGTDNDELHGGAGNDVILGGAGVDTAVYARNASDYRVSLDGAEILIEALVGDEGVDRLAEVEKVEFADGVVSASTILASAQNGGPAPAPPSGRTIVGTSAGETLKGGDPAELIQAGAGNDIVYARAGDDRVEGGDGVDWLYGQDGDDALIGGTGNDKLDGGAGNDRLDGGTGSDELHGGDGDDVLVWSQGEDRYFGDAGTDSLAGGAGDEVLTLTSFGPSNSIERIDGAGGQNIIVGDQYSNLLDFRSATVANVAEIDGGHGADRIYGSAGADVILGGAGADTLNGMAGGDRLTGGSGADRFLFERGCGADVVTDFLVGGEADRIDLTAFDLDGFAALKALCVESAGEVTIDLAGADSVTLMGKRLAELSVDHFLL